MSDVSLAVGAGLVCALLSALGTNLAFLLKQKGAVAAPDVDMRHPLRSAIDLFRSKWWSVGWGVAVVAFALHVAALSLAPLSIGQAVLAGGLVCSGPDALLSPWSVVIVTAAMFSFFASARSLQIGDGVAVIAVTSVAANLSTIVAGLAVYGDRLGNDAPVVGVRLAAFALILVGTALIPAPVRAGEALEESDAAPERPPVTSA